jgi:phosphoserine/homoserine phosphotransferase
MHIVCTDLEGVLVPEIWINVALKTGISDLKLTTRDIPDYDVLMRQRLEILYRYGLKLKDITDVIDTMDPIPGALDLLNWLRESTQVIIVSDTFEEFAKPLMAKLGYPTLFCNSLEIDAAGAVVGYRLRQKDGKRHVVEALRQLNFTVIAMGDSYNDITMIQHADHGLLFCPPDKLIAEYPNLPVTRNYNEVKQALQPMLR